MRVSNTVIIKGNKHGITVVLNGDDSFADLKNSVREKFRQSAAFFGKADMALAFEGRFLSEDQQIQLMEIIQEETEMNILCIVDLDKDRDALFEAAVKTQTELQEEIPGTTTAHNNNAGGTSEGLFYKGTLRSGQVLECETSIIIIGDVNPGAKILSTGNIVILGALKGTAYAGASGNEACFVAALDMNPVQIKIGNIIGRSEDKGILASIRERKKVAAEPQVATISDGHILIEPITKNTFNNI